MSENEAIMLAIILLRRQHPEAPSMPEVGLAQPLYEAIKSFVEHANSAMEYLQEPQVGYRELIVFIEAWRVANPTVDPIWWPGKSEAKPQSLELGTGDAPKKERRVLGKRSEGIS